MNKANVFMHASSVGAVFGIAALANAVIGVFSDRTTVYLTVFCMLSCWVMLFTRNADEYTRGLWTSAASLAFAVVLLMYIGLPFAEGFVDGLTDSVTDTRETTMQTSDDLIFGLALIAFYVGLFWKRESEKI